MIIATLDAKWAPFVESYTKGDTPVQQTFQRILQVVDEQMWINFPPIRRIRRWLKVEKDPNEPIYNYMSRFEMAMDEAKTATLTWEN